MELEAVSDRLFEDPDFPPDDSSLFSDYTTPISRLHDQVTWLRPQEICQSPKLFPDNPSEGHAKQGILGDCWFLCACTMLLKNKHLMSKVLPPGQPQWGEGGYSGSFLLRFWRRGRWTEVRVDDLLPCVGTNLCFSRCQSPDAFWVAILEKAYAKLHGSYEHLWAGQVCEAMVDLSGGLAERWSLGELEKEEQSGDRPLGRRRLDLDLLQAVRDQCAISCSVHSSPGAASELGQYHALSVVEWAEGRTVDGGRVRLLRIRNPWGRRCWGGAWTESGEGWSSLEPASALDLLGRTEEGEFWVDEAEFLEEFDEVTVGYPVSDEGHLQSIYTGMVLTHSHQIGGRWIKGRSAGGCRNNSSFGSNPKFWLRVSEAGEVLVALHQNSRQGRTAQLRERREDPLGGSTQQHPHYQAIALHMWKVEKKHCNLARTLSKPPCASTRCHAYDREVVLHAHLSAGFHLLLPSIFLQGAEACFLLRVHSSTPCTLSAVRVPEPMLSSAPEGEWETGSFQGSWTPGSSAGGSRNYPSHGRNPCIPLTVTYDPGGVNVRVTLRQNCPNTALQAIGFHIYKLPKVQATPGISSDQEPVASCVPHCYTQEVSLACSLQPGAYAILPSTYQPDLHAHFTITAARKIHRKVVKSQENLGTAVQEVSCISVMQRS